MKSTLRRLATDKSIQKFLIVGVLSFAVDYGLLLILHDGFSVQLNVATTAAYLAGLLLNFSLNKMWTFSAPRGARQSAKQAAQYTVLVCFNLLFTNIIVGGAALAGIGPELSKPISTGVIMILNYIVYQRVIFRSKPPVEPFVG